MFLIYRMLLRYPGFYSEELQHYHKMFLSDWYMFFCCGVFFNMAGNRRVVPNESKKSSSRCLLYYRKGIWLVCPVCLKTGCLLEAIADANSWNTKHSICIFVLFATRDQTYGLTGYNERCKGY